MRTWLSKYAWESENLAVHHSISAASSSPLLPASGVADKRASSEQKLGRLPARGDR